MTDSRLPDEERLFHPDAKDGSGRQRDVLALGRRDGAAAADEDAEERPLGAAEDAADDRADAGPRADLGGFTLDALALDRLRHRRVDRIGAAVDGELIERHRHRAPALGARGLL